MAEDMEFQENARKLSLNGFSYKENIFVNGWTQLIAIRQLYPSYKNIISDDLKTLTEDIIAKNDTFDVSKNIRGDVKKFLMFPTFEYPPWEKYTSSDRDQLLCLCRRMNTIPCKLKVVRNKLYLMLELPEDIRKLSNNFEEPHITIINSNKFTNEHKKYEDDIIDDIEYYEISKTTSNDYTPFKEVVVVNCKSKKLETLFGKKEYHYTIFIRERTPYNFDSSKKI